MGEGTAKKSFKVQDRNSDDWYVFFFHIYLANGQVTFWAGS